MRQFHFGRWSHTGRGQILWSQSLADKFIDICPLYKLSRSVLVVATCIYCTAPVPIFKQEHNHLMNKIVANAHVCPRYPEKTDMAVTTTEQLGTVLDKPESFFLPKLVCYEIHD